MRMVWATVTQVRSDLADLQRLAVTADDGDDAHDALCYPALSGRCAEGDRVLLNTTAVGLGLGTGGQHFVVARAGEGVMLDDPAPGHIMKLRYTPLQRDVCSVEEQDSPHHAVMAQATSLDGMPVACCGLHSQVAVVAAAIKEQRPDARVVYAMTDGAALPLALSGVLRHAVEAGLVDATVTCGQAFGGTYEAVNLHSGLLAAHHVVHADAAIVAIGPGVVGTATPFGHGGVAQGEAIDAVSVLGGVAVACLRISAADRRPRHRGVSHHTLTALGKVALASALVAVPDTPEARALGVEGTLDAAGLWDRHREVRVPVTGLPDMRGIEPRSMGRSYADDPVFFQAAVAAGMAVARQITRK